jgi:hypothetical protein
VARAWSKFRDIRVNEGTTVAKFHDPKQRRTGALHSPLCLEGIEGRRPREEERSEVALLVRLRIAMAVSAFNSILSFSSRHNPARLSLHVDFRIQLGTLNIGLKSQVAGIFKSQSYQQAALDAGLSSCDYGKGHALTTHSTVPLLHTRFPTGTFLTQGHTANDPFRV